MSDSASVQDLPPGDSESNAAPTLTVVLATDSLRTVQSVVRALERQTIAEQLELVFVLPEGDIAGQPPRHQFAATRIVQVESVYEIGRARAAGVRAASGEFVFVGETHSYLRPEACELLLDAAREGSDVVVPGFVNQNPKSRVSWAGFLGDYGAWLEQLPAAEIDRTPIYNVLIRTAVLLDQRHALDRLLGQGDQLHLALQRAKARIRFHPAAVIGHVNVARLRHIIREHWLVGRLVAGQRAQRWSWPRRLLYCAAWPLIAVVLFRRPLAGVRKAIALGLPPRGIMPLMFLLNLARSLGESCSYVFGTPRNVEHASAAYEIHKLDYAG